ncbi:hypothetical protein CCACVL1_22979 [Corchorus capsularis]|uniref:Uncharacterized protein n=1 Tax=Corchorus capsularis TaxID=210143 RepID=A0A1R3GW02_COCAP|nr:hypothetical protein CCACVL1_22979 [Corchorus capsularis]
MDDEYVKKSVLSILQKLSRNQHYKLHKHFKKFSSAEVARQKKPADGNLTQENWDSLCDLFSDPEYQRKEEQEPDRIEVFKATHYSEAKGWFQISNLQRRPCPFLSKASPPPVIATVSPTLAAVNAFHRNPRCRYPKQVNLQASFLLCGQFLLLIDLCRWQCIMLRDDTVVVSSHNPLPVLFPYINLTSYSPAYPHGAYADDVVLYGVVTYGVLYGAIVPYGVVPHGAVGGVAPDPTLTHGSSIASSSMVSPNKNNLLATGGHPFTFYKAAISALLKGNLVSNRGRNNSQGKLQDVKTVLVFRSSTTVVPNGAAFPIKFFWVSYKWRTPNQFVERGMSSGDRSCRPPYEGNAFKGESPTSSV